MTPATPDLVDAWKTPVLDSNGHATPSSIDIPMSSLTDTLDDVDLDLDDLDDKTREQENHVGHRVCSKCGAEVVPGHHFCGNCGARYTSSFELGSIDEESMDPNESSFSRRMVARVSFVNNMAIPTSHASVRFSLHHIRDDGTIGEEIKLKSGENIIGRQSSLALAADRFVSPKHARIICHRDKATIEDYGSLNGVFLRISGDSIQLSDGDAFRIGEELLCFSEGTSKQTVFADKIEEDTQLLGGKEPRCWGYLRVILGPFSEGDVYRLDSPEITIGRKTADVLFPKDGFVSGTHSKITHTDRGNFLTDLESSNGTFLKISDSVTIRDSAYILLGNQLLQLKALSK